MANHRRSPRDTHRDSGQDRSHPSSAPYYSESQRNDERYGDNRYGRQYGQDYPYTERNYNQQHAYPYGTGTRSQSNYRGGTYEGGYSNPDYRHADDYLQPGGYDFRQQQGNDYNGDYRQRGNDRRDYRPNDFGNTAHESREYHNPWERANEGNAQSPWPESNQARFWQRQGNERPAGQHRGKGPKGYTRTDERIKDDISDRLADHDDIDASDIEITVTKGEVVLSGTVGDRYEKRIAEECAEQVSGVTNVENRIRLQQQGSTFDNVGGNERQQSGTRPAYTSDRSRAKNGNQPVNES